VGENKIDLNNIEENTTHNRMELLAVISAIDHVLKEKIPFLEMEIYSDSQYVVDLMERKEKLKGKNFLTNRGTPIQNADLVLYLIRLMEQNPLSFIKVKAHQKSTSEINYNREADILVRSLLRSYLNKKSNG